MKRYRLTRLEDAATRASTAIQLNAGSRFVDWFTDNNGVRACRSYDCVSDGLMMWHVSMSRDFCPVDAAEVIAMAKQLCPTVDRWEVDQQRNGTHAYQFLGLPDVE